MKKIAIFGGSGYIGTFLAQYALENWGVDEVVIYDIKDTPLKGHKGVRYVHQDVRNPIAIDVAKGEIDWIFNFAAIHREPGHLPLEYFDTNIKGAINVSNYANDIGCKNIYFTSSISVYGPTTGPTSESARICPISPYGGSKYPAELIHQKWLVDDATKRLIVVRPGVVFGPRDPGNIGRMVKAIQKGYFAFPGSTNIYKSYAYVYGLLESIDFVIKSNEGFITYNYVETPTETLGGLANLVKEFTGSKAPIFSIPAWILIPIAQVVQLLIGNRNPIHPVRVKKARMETHIVPQKLIDMGFNFRYSFGDALSDWKRRVPADFN